MKKLFLALMSALLACAALGALMLSGGTAAADEAAYEVWAIDQSDTAADGGGLLYIYNGAQLAGGDAAIATPEVIDLGVDARLLCKALTGSAPRRPHMLFFNAANTHGILSFVATGHILFIDTATRTPVGCVDAGLQAHAAVPSPTDDTVLVANQNGKLLQRIRADYATNSYALEAAATLNLASCTTPSGAACQDPALRPDNAPICPVVDRTGGLAFVTLRGGGLLVVDPTATPMAIVGEYDRATIHPNGCGGVEAAGRMYINSGGGTLANPLESDLYALPLSGYSPANPPNTPAPRLVFSHDDRGFVDSHGAALVGDRYLWVADRAANVIVVVDTTTDTVVHEIALVGAVSPDPAPDLVDVSPNGTRVFLTLRGSSPLTANDPTSHNAEGQTPGIGVVRVERDGARGTLQAIAPLGRVVAGVDVADPHGLRVRRR